MVEMTDRERALGVLDDLRNWETRPDIRELLADALLEFAAAEVESCREGADRVIAGFREAGQHTGGAEICRNFCVRRAGQLRAQKLAQPGKGAALASSSRLRKPLRGADET